MTKLNYYATDNSAQKFEEYIAILLMAKKEEEEFNEDCICDGLELKLSIELPEEHDYTEFPSNRLLGDALN